jgi:hypothetical protein
MRLLIMFIAIVEVYSLVEDLVQKYVHTFGNQFLIAYLLGVSVLGGMQLFDKLMDSK